MQKCALVIGHKKASPGAVNIAADTTEFDFNDRLSIDISSAVTDVEVQRIYRRTYRTLPGDINEYDPDFVISMHCNAFNQQASGTEVLFYHKSKKGRSMAQVVQQQMLDALGLKDRGVKPRTVEDRGGFLLRHTAAPCIIAEPFFIDNDDDFKAVTTNREALVKAYAEAISEISSKI